MKDYYNLVKACLEKYPEARDDDMILYAYIVYKVSDLKANIGFYTVMKYHDKYNLPSYESVTRARRKVQEKEPRLRGAKHGRRKELEEEYRDYYGG